MPSIKLTDARIKRVAYDHARGGIQRHWDTAIAGLGVECYASGRKSWVLRYSLHGVVGGANLRINGEQ